MDLGKQKMGIIQLNLFPNVGGYFEKKLLM